jgi:hypothetical protein
MHCAGRHSQEASKAYASLSAQTSNPRYIDPSISKNLCFADITVLNNCTKLLTRMRREIFERIIVVLHAKYPQAQGVTFKDLSHTRNHCMKLIGSKRGIPGAQVADYDDVYAGYAAQVPENVLLQNFDAEYTPTLIVEYFYKNAHYPTPQLGMKPAIDGKDLVDFFAHHAPEEVQKKSYEDKMELIMEEDPDDVPVTFKRSYLAQMLHFLEVIAPN